MVSHCRSFSCCSGLSSHITLYPFILCYVNVFSAPVSITEKVLYKCLIIIIILSMYISSVYIYSTSFWCILYPQHQLLYITPGSGDPSTIPDTVISQLTLPDSGGFVIIILFFWFVCYIIRIYYIHSISCWDIFHLFQQIIVYMLYVSTPTI